MRKRVLLLILGLGLLTLVVIVARPAPPDYGPSYNGQSLYQWLDIEMQSIAGLTTPAQSNEAFRAVINIGTNGLPWLVSSVRNTPGSAGDNFKNLAHKLPPFLNPNHWLCRHAPGEEAQHRSSLAIEGFRLLGTNALPVLPELTSIMNTAGTSAPARYALFSISHMGQAALPTIIPVLTNTNHGQHAMAVGVMGATMWHLGTNAASAVPALLQCANEPNAEIARDARFALSFIVGGRKPEYPDAGPNVPEQLTNSSPH